MYETMSESRKRRGSRHLMWPSKKIIHMHSRLKFWFNEQNRWFNVAQKTLNWATRMGEWLPNTQFTQITELHNHEREITNQPKCRTSASMDRGPVTTGELPHDLTDTSNGSGWCKDGNNQILSGVSTGQNMAKWSTSNGCFQLSDTIKTLILCVSQQISHVWPLLPRGSLVNPMRVSRY